MRLNKYIAHSGLCSRRQAAEYVKNGQIQLNGAVFINPAYEVQEGDEVKFKGKILKPELRQVYLLMNKPKDTVTTLSDEKGRRTVMDLLPSTVTERVYPVGRLDRATTGLLLLTNDGDLTKKLSHPSHEIKKVYHVVLERPVSEKDLQLIRNGLNLEDGLAEVDGVSHIKNTPKNEVGIELHSGRNRIIRRIFEHLNYDVKRLDRTFYAGLTKKDLPRGRTRFLTKQEVIMLKHFV